MLLTLPAGHAPWTVFNYGVNGESLATMLANAPTVVDPRFTSAHPSVDTVWGGTNDIASGATVAATYANMVSYVAARHAVGWKVIVPTMLSRVGLDVQKNAYNALILANTAGADAIADFTGTPLGCDGCYTNSTWFQADGIHPTQAGITTYEAPIISTAAAPF